MVDSLLKDILAPITQHVASLIENKIQSKEYIRNMYKLLSANYKRRLYMKNILHTSSPVLFRDIYCPLSITKWSTYDYEDSHTTYKVESISGLMDQIDNIAIFGNAGCGKSTLVNYLYLNSIEERYKYPIIVNLRYLNLSSDSLIEHLKSLILGCNPIEGSDKIFSSLLENGYFLFFFDGYDEIRADKQYNITVQIKELTTKYTENKYVLTSRPLEQLYALDSFHNYVIAPLSQSERNEFIKKQFPKNKQKFAEAIIRKISNDSNGIYAQLLNTPLLIILCILNFNLHSDLPIKRADFYSRIFDALYQEHDWRSKNGFERTRKCNLQKDEYISILSKLSFFTHFGSEYFFTKERLISIFEIIKSDKTSNLNIQQVDTGSLFDDLNVAINILIADGNFYSFPHKSFQEYYAAIYIIKKNESARKEIYQKLRFKFLNGNVFSLTAPLLEMLYELDRDMILKHFIVPLLKEIEDLIVNNSLKFFNEFQLTHILSIINNLLYGEDLSKLRHLFSVNRIGYHLEEIRKLQIDASLIESLDDSDGDIFMDDF